MIAVCDVQLVVTGFSGGKRGELKIQAQDMLRAAFPEYPLFGTDFEVADVGVVIFHGSIDDHFSEDVPYESFIRRILSALERFANDLPNLDVIKIDSCVGQGAVFVFSIDAVINFDEFEIVLSPSLTGVLSEHRICIEINTKPDTR